MDKAYEMDNFNLNNQKPAINKLCLIKHIQK